MRASGVTCLRQFIRVSCSRLSKAVSLRVRGSRLYKAVSLRVRGS